MNPNEQFSESMLLRIKAQGTSRPPAPPSISSDWDMVQDVDSCDSPGAFANVSFATENDSHKHSSAISPLSQSVTTGANSGVCGPASSAEMMGMSRTLSLPAGASALEPDTLDSGSSTPSSCLARSSFDQLASDAVDNGSHHLHEANTGQGGYSSNGHDDNQDVVPSDSETWAQYLWSLLVCAGKTVEEFCLSASGWCSSLSGMSREKFVNAVQLHISKWGQVYATGTAVVFSAIAAYYFQQSRCLRAEMDKRNADFAKMMVAYVNLRDQLESRRYPVIGWASCSAQCPTGFAAHVL